MKKYNLTSDDCELIQRWIIEQYSPILEDWLNDEYIKHLQEIKKESLNYKSLNDIESWLINILLPTFEEHLVKKYNLNKKPKEKFTFLKKLNTKEI